ncbi:MAG: hypothetical protein A4E57_04923 [Syntrophorhabdaceae bacterium PtaU1.Bin034]|jgi:hypothetical protein|nr:MAG: hypothetical protein A4E57_04923 [Syntrophorhabdaceae bacterium PtaU1.Bin034]
MNNTKELNVVLYALTAFIAVCVLACLCILSANKVHANKVQAVKSAEPGEEAGRPLEEPPEELRETDIGSFHIRIGIPVNVLRQSWSFNQETRIKITGKLAVQTLKKYILSSRFRHLTIRLPFGVISDK